MNRSTKYIVNALLVLSAMLSVLLSYHIVFDMSKYGDGTIETLAPQMRDNVEFYGRTSPSLTMLFSPDTLVIQQGKDTYKMSTATVIETLGQLLVDYPAELDDAEIVRNGDFYQAVLHKERIEMNYFAHFPIEFIEPFVVNKQDKWAAFQVNRIVFLKDEPNYAYLFNSTDKSHIRVNLSKSVSYTQLQKIVKLGENEWELVDPMMLQRTVAYLPLSRTEYATQTYLLEKIPESKLVVNVFGSVDYSVGETLRGNDKKYSTIQTELTLDFDNQMMNYSLKQSQSKSIETDYQKVKETVDLVRKHDYWRDTLRYSGQYQTSVVYRRYLNGLPIVHARNRYQMNGIDYATTRVKLGGREYAYIMPTIVTYARIDSNNEINQLENYQDIQAKLQRANIEYENIARIVLGYEWQENTELLKAVTLIPKWFVEVEGYYFTLDEVENGKVEEIQRARSGANGL